MGAAILFDDIQSVFLTRQYDICAAFEAMDTASFSSDNWHRPNGGGGLSRLLTGTVFEKAGVNTSVVFGDIQPDEAPMFTTLLSNVSNESLCPTASFKATGISLVVHPVNPFIPTVHANYRYFELTNGDTHHWWFGGGADLTPYYMFDEDAIHFHDTHKQVCNTLSSTAYDTFKNHCDRYFYLPHRKETRGIGGIFFDYLNDDATALFDFISLASNIFLDAYLPIVHRRINTAYTEHHRKWQAIRRGRYAEFNLVHDRGTLFGLKTNGRVESVLMSMPPTASWVYNHVPEPGSQEALLVSILQSPKQWA